MTPEDISDSLKKYQEFFRREITRNVSMGKLTHLTGRIGELYVANKTKRSIAI